MNNDRAAVIAAAGEAAKALANAADACAEVVRVFRRNEPVFAPYMNGKTLGDGIATVFESTERYAREFALNLSRAVLVKQSKAGDA